MTVFVQRRYVLTAIDFFRLLRVNHTKKLYIADYLNTKIRLLTMKIIAAKWFGDIIICTV